MKIHKGWKRLGVVFGAPSLFVWTVRFVYDLLTARTPAQPGELAPWVFAFFISIAGLAATACLVGIVHDIFVWIQQGFLGEPSLMPVLPESAPREEAGQLSLPQKEEPVFTKIGTGSK